MHRTVEDYDSMAKREIIKAKQEKAMMCVCSELNPALILHRISKFQEAMNGD